MNEILTFFNCVAVTETRCTELYAACAATWQPAFATDGAAGAHQALDELEALFGRAAALERQCADLAPQCERHWRSALAQRSLSMPELHGTELAAQLVARQPELRVLYISGYAEHASLTVETLAQHTLLAKPFTGSELARIVRAVLDQTA